MKKLIQKFFWVLLLGVLPFFPSGCAIAPADAPPFVLAPVAPEGFSTLYIYRGRIGTNVLSANIKIAGVEAMSLQQNGYSWIHVRSGAQNIVLEWSPAVLSSFSSVSANYTFEPGKSHYLRLVAGVSLVGGLFSNRYVSSTGFEQVRNEHAEAELKVCCRYQKAVTTVVN
jgi:hypothetical protein